MLLHASNMRRITSDGNKQSSSRPYDLLGDCSVNVHARRHTNPVLTLAETPEFGSAPDLYPS